MPTLREVCGGQSQFYFEVSGEGGFPYLCYFVTCLPSHCFSNFDVLLRAPNP